MPDYSPYLQRIVEALQQRPTPTWVVALVASIVGGLFAVGAQIAKAMFDEHRRRKLLSNGLPTLGADEQERRPGMRAVARGPVQTLAGLLGAGGLKESA